VWGEAKKSGTDCVVQCFTTCIAKSVPNRDSSADLLEKSVCRYQNRAIEAAQVIEAPRRGGPPPSRHQRHPEVPENRVLRRSNRPRATECSGPLAGAFAISGSDC
jgi:hypothetical protein